MRPPTREPPTPLGEPPCPAPNALVPCGPPASCPGARLHLNRPALPPRPAGPTPPPRATGPLRPSSAIALLRSPAATRPLWLLLLTLALAPVLGGAAEPSETEVKAVFLYKFAKFVEWPVRAFTNATAPLVIGVVGADALGKLLEEIVANETAGGRKLTVRRFASEDDPRACHVLFVGHAERERWPDLLRALGTSPVLTVSDLDRFTDQGGMIQFFKVKNNIRFTIAQAVATRCNLTIGSKLLHLSQPLSSN